MHRDKKIGLSLGVLLVGIVAAIFFRNEAQPTEEPPQLEDWESLNEEIAQEDIGPYLAPPKPPEASEPEDAPAPPVPDYDESGFVTPFEEPIPLDDRQAEPVEQPVERGGRNASATSSRLNAGWEDIPAERADDEASSRFHVVERGETLSEIAERHLGSHTRFREIYELNRDLLSDPDAVRAGMRLRIPAHRTRATAAKEERKSRAVNRLWREVDPVGSTKRSPSESGVEGASRRRSRSLSQAPPVDLPRLDDESPVRAVPRTYRVEAGDSLERIAVRFYGRRGASQEIYEANRDRLESPDAIRKGMTLVLP